MSRVATEAIVFAHRHGLASHGRAANPQQPSAFSALLDDIGGKSQSQGTAQAEAVSSNVKDAANETVNPEDNSPEVKPRSSGAGCRRIDNGKAPSVGPQIPPRPDATMTKPAAPGDVCGGPITKPEAPELVSTTDDSGQPRSDPNAGSIDATGVASVPVQPTASAALLAPPASANDPNIQPAGGGNVGSGSNDAIAATAGEPKGAEDAAVRRPAQAGTAANAAQGPAARAITAAEKPASAVTAEDSTPAPNGSGAADGADQAAGDANSTGGNEHSSVRAGPADSFEALVQKARGTAGKPRGDDETGAIRDMAKPAADAAQPASPPPPVERFGHLASAAPAAHAGTAATAETAAVPVAGLAIEIAARVQAGHNRFEIRLDPPELGRIDVRLDVDHKGHVTSHLVVEKAETLDLLKRDAPELERALQQAGLKTGDGGLQFTLRDQAFAGRNGNDATPELARVIVPDAELASVETAQSSYGSWSRLDGGIDIRV